MAARESDFHQELCKEIRHQLQGFAVKISDRHIAGISDVYSQTPGYGSLWVECKFELLPKRVETLIPVGMTVNQRNFIKSIRGAGGWAGWALCVKHPDRSWSYYSSWNWTTEAVQQNGSYFRCHRKAGEALDIHTILAAIRFGEVARN